MASIADQIRLLANPEPTNLDPEDDELDSTRAKIVKGDPGGENANNSLGFSALRRGNAPLLVEEDSKYHGQRVSRAELALMRGDFQASDRSVDGADQDESDEDYNNDSLEDSLHNGRHGTLQEESDDNDEHDNYEGNIKSDKDFTQLGNAETVHEDRYGDDDEEEEEEEDDSDDDDSDEDKEVTLSDQDSGGVQSFSATKMEDELEKGKAVKHQLSFWDSFLEYRIRIQKALVLANKLPQPGDMTKFMATNDSNLKHAQRQGRKAMSDLLHQLLLVQEKLLEQNSETQNILYPGSKDSSINNAGSKNDEEIPSDSDEEELDKKNDAYSKQDNVNAERTESLKLHVPLKRKGELASQEFSDCIAKRHAAFQSYRDSTISKWSEKTRLASGKLNSKAFSSFDRSALTQIKQIMSNKERVIKRTQLKRSSYRVLGKTEKEPSTAPENQPSDQADVHLRDHDTEVFDDDDFYHQLLRELIERRTSRTTEDPIEMGRQWLELQKLRRKIKKKVDTRASKGRKIRYNVHSKLVGYMAPMDRGPMPDASRNELFSSLFGQRQSETDSSHIQVFR